MNEQELLTEIKRLEGIYMNPQDFKQYKNYWLPEYIVKESTNVLSLGVHRDVGWEQSMLQDNPNMNRTTKTNNICNRNWYSASN